MKLRRPVLILLVSLTSAPLVALEAAQRCVVKDAERYACLKKVGNGEYAVFIRSGERSRTEPLPGPPSHRLRMGSARDVVLTGGALGDGGSAERWARLIGLDGTIMSFQGSPFIDAADTGDWLAVQAVERVVIEDSAYDLPPGEVHETASSDQPLVIYGLNGREVRRVPGLVDFRVYPEEVADLLRFSNDGRALSIFRSKSRTVAIYGLDGEVSDQVLSLDELTPGFDPIELEFIDADRIVMWQPEMFGRNDPDWLRTLVRDSSGRFASRSIVHREAENYLGYGDLRGITTEGRMLLWRSGRGEPGGYDVVSFSGELVWRMNFFGWSDLTEAMPERHLQRWQPSLLPNGDVLLTDHHADGSRERMVVHLTEVRESSRFAAKDGIVVSERAVVFDGDQPLATVESITVVPPEALILDGSGRYALVDPDGVPRPIEAIGVDAKEHDR